MVTFIIPTFMNPVGLSSTIAFIKDLFGTTAEILVLFSQNDKALGLGKAVCDKQSVRYISFESPSYTAWVNYAACVVSTPFMCVINDDILITKSEGYDKEAILAALTLHKDTLIALYLCSKEENDAGFRYPIVSKRFTELVGYLYHPICASQDVCECWLGSIFDSLDRVLSVPGYAFTNNQECPGNIVFDSDVVEEAKYLYTRTGRIRQKTASMLSPFLIKE